MQTSSGSASSFPYSTPKSGSESKTISTIVTREANERSLGRTSRLQLLSCRLPGFDVRKHSQLTGNVDFQNNLLHALLSVDR